MIGSKEQFMNERENESLPKGNDYISMTGVEPVSKERVNNIIQNILNKLEDGEISALKYKIFLKFLENIVSGFKKTSLDKLARSEAEKYSEKQFALHGATVALAETGTSYDYSGCNDSTLNDLNVEFEKLTTEIEDRKTFLKTLKSSIEIFNRETGEIGTINPPVKYSTSSLKITL